MERAQEELHLLGFFGIIKESCKIILEWRTHFSQITLALILPLSFIFLAHIQISQYFFYNIQYNQDGLEFIATGAPRYRRLQYVTSTEWAAFWFFEAAYLTFLLLLSLLSTSAIAYTIACIYTAKEITFKKVMSAVPKVWKRLTVTLVLSFIIVFVYNIIAVGLMYLDVAITELTTIGIVILVVFLLLYLVGFVYIGIVWHLACVVSVLEDVKGVKALKKSKKLIKGKMGVAAAIFLLLSAYLVAIEYTFELIVVLGEAIGIDLGIRIGVGILCMILLFKMILSGLVIQTVIYFVCKSHHHEGIDRTALAYHLEVIHLGNYVPPKAMDVQLQQSHV